MQIPTPAELAALSLRVQHPRTRTWVTDSPRLSILTEQHRDDVLLATDDDIAAQRARRFAPGAPADVFLNRWTQVSEDLTAMVSMRYEGGDPGLPFVDASTLSRAVQADDLAWPHSRRRHAQPMDAYIRAIYVCGARNLSTRSRIRNQTSGSWPHRWLRCALGRCRRSCRFVQPLI